MCSCHDTLSLEQTGQDGQGGQDGQVGQVGQPDPSYQPYLTYPPYPRGLIASTKTSPSRSASVRTDLKPSA